MMDKAGLLARLRQHQDEVLAILAEAEPLLRDPAGGDVAALARARWALMRAMTAYQLFKHTRLFDPAIGRSAPGVKGRAERMKQACVAIGDELRAYVARWSATDVAGQWASYRPAALAMTEKVKRHIARERTECAALIERV